MGIGQIFDRDSNLVSFSGTQLTKVVQLTAFKITENNAGSPCCFYGVDTDLPDQLDTSDTIHKTFIADRPFMFFIEHEPSGTLFLSGKVTNPNL